MSKSDTLKRYNIQIRIKERKRGEASLRAQKDSDKIALLYETYEQEMFRVAFGVLKDKCKAEDAVSESFLKLIRNRDRIGEVKSASVRLYVMRTVKNTAIDMYRAVQRELKNTATVPESDKWDGLSAADDFTDDVVSTDVRELLSTLSPKYRTAMEAVFVDGLTVKEAAAVLMTSEASLRKRIERARKQLANLREKERNK